MEGVFGVAVEDRLHRPQRAARDRGARVVHPGEGGVVAGPDARLGSNRVRIDGEASDGVQVGWRMDRQQFSVGRGLGLERRHRTDPSEQLDAGAEAARRERMLGSEVVGQRARPEDEERSVHHRLIIAGREDRRRSMQPTVQPAGVAQRPPSPRPSARPAMPNGTGA